MPLLSRNNRKILYIFIAFLFGIFIDRFIKEIPFLKLDRTIDILEIFEIFVALLTLGVAVYIASIVEPKKKKEEYIFEFVKSRLEDVKKDISNLYITLSERTVPIHIVNLKLKNISTAYLEFKESMELLDKRIESQAHDEVLSLIRHTKRLCTEIPSYKYPTKVIEYTDKAELKFDSNNIIFSDSRIDKVKEFSNRIYNLLFKKIIS